MQVVTFSWNPMQFILIDRILELEPGRRIVAVKNLTLAEEYLAEHFPGFPVLPGVLMLEAMAQASAWLIRVSESYAHSVVVLKSVKAVKYGSFVTPGQQLRIEAEIARQTDCETELRAKGTTGAVATASGRITMERYNLRDREPALEAADRDIVAFWKKQFPLLAGDGLRNTQRSVELAPSGSSAAIA